MISDAYAAYVVCHHGKQSTIPATMKRAPPSWWAFGQAHEQYKKASTRRHRVNLPMRARFPDDFACKRVRQRASKKVRVVRNPQTV
jgi:hypothetical protein